MVKSLTWALALGSVTLAVGLLGPLEVVSDGREVRIVGVKERAGLALLALAAPRAVSAER